MFSRLFPSNNLIFDRLDQLGFLSYQVALKLKESLSQTNNTSALEQIKTLEHEADGIAKNSLEILHKTFITPIDRDLIYVLVSRIDDVIDSVDAAADCLIIYKINKPTKELIKFADIIIQAVKEMQTAVKGLRNLKKTDTIRAACSEINKFEHQADDALKLTLENLFQNELDARQLIIWKQIYETLEDATDRCTDVADTIEGILLEIN